MRRVVFLLIIAILASCGVQNNPTITPPAIPTKASNLPAPPTTSTVTSTTIPTQTPSDSTNQLEKRTLIQTTPHMQGDDVSYLQQRLVDLGYPQVGEVDGFYGPKTAEAVRSFQEFNGLSINGIVTQVVWTRLDAPDVVRYTSSGVPKPNPNSLVYLKPDGKTLMWLNLVDHSESLFMRLNLTAKQTVKHIAADPTGTYINITIDNDGKIESSVYSFEGVLLNVKPMGWAQWSSNGYQMIVQGYPQSGDVAKYVFDAQRGTTVMQAPMIDAAWNASGDQVIAVMRYEANIEIKIFDLRPDGDQQNILDLPTQGAEGWQVSSAQYAPDEKFIYFYGGQTKDFDASGNGGRWWVVALRGETAGCNEQPTGCGEPKPLTPPSASGVDQVEYNPERTAMVYSSSFSNSECSATEKIELAEGMLLEKVSSPPQQNTDRVHIYNIMWLDNQRVAFSQATYTCADDRKVYATPHVFVWDLTTNTLSDLAEGSYPIWIKAN